MLLRVYVETVVRCVVGMVARTRKVVEFFETWMTFKMKFLNWVGEHPIVAVVLIVAGPLVVGVVKVVLSQVFENLINSQC